MGLNAKVSAAQVLEYAREHGGYFTTQQAARALNVPLTHVRSRLLELELDGELIIKERHNEARQYQARPGIQEQRILHDRIPAILRSLAHGPNTITTLAEHHQASSDAMRDTLRYLQGLGQVQTIAVGNTLIGRLP